MLQRVFEGNDHAVLSSVILQLNLFGTYGQPQIKVKHLNEETKAYQDLCPGADNTIAIPFAEVPIL